MVSRTGSIFAARLAGMPQATAAMAVKATPTITNVAGSAGVTPKRKLARYRRAAALLAQQPEQQVFGAYVVVQQPVGFFARVL